MGIFIRIIIFHLIVLSIILLTGPEQMLGKSKIFLLLFNFIFLTTIFLIGIGARFTTWIYRDIYPIELYNFLNSWFVGARLTSENFSEVFPKAIKSGVLVILLTFVIIVNTILGLSITGININNNGFIFLGIVLMWVLIAGPTLMRFFIKRV